MTERKWALALVVSSKYIEKKLKLYLEKLGTS
jgi:hypothetical protein